MTNKKNQNLSNYNAIITVWFESKYILNHKIFRISHVIRFEMYNHHFSQFLDENLNLDLSIVFFLNVLREVWIDFWK